MQFYYGNQMPLRVLDEAEFWKQQEAEHTVVMRELVDDLEIKYIDGLRRWKHVLESTHHHVTRFVESVKRSGNQMTPRLYHQVLELVAFCEQESNAFIQYCRDIKHNSQAITTNPTAKIVIDHIVYESEYFIGIAQTILHEKKIQP